MVPRAQARRVRGELAVFAVDERWANDRPFERAGFDDGFGGGLGAVVFGGRVWPGPEGGHVDIAQDLVADGGVDHVAGEVDVHAREGDVAREVLGDDADKVNRGRCAREGRGRVAAGRPDRRGRGVMRGSETARSRLWAIAWTRKLRASNSRRMAAPTKPDAPVTVTVWAFTGEL